MTTQVKEVSRNDATTAAVAENNKHEMRRRGFFATLAATVAGVVGIGKTNRISVRPPHVLKEEKTVVSIHPNAIARTEEGSRRHG